MRYRTVPLFLGMLYAISSTIAAIGCASGEETGDQTTAPSITSSSSAVTTGSTSLEPVASGSGCTSGDGPLSSGRWFGYVEETTASSIEFDLACWFEGEAAVTATAEDGEESPPPNDYYVRNDNPALRTLEVAADATVTWIPEGGDPASTTVVTFEEWVRGQLDREFQLGVWLTVDGESVTAIEEQYVP